MHKQTIRVVSALGVAALLLLGGAFVDPNIAFGAAMLPFIMGDTEFTSEDARKMFEAVEEFKRTNDKRLAEMKDRGEKGSAEVQEKMAKLNTTIDTIMDGFEAQRKAADAEKKRTDEIEATLKRIGKQMETGEKIDTKHMEAYRALYGEDVGVEQYLAHKKAVNTYLRAKGSDNALAEFEAKMMSVDSQPNGGYFVLPDTSGRIVSYIYESSPLRSVAAVQGIGTDALEGTYDHEEAGDGWVGERQSRPETSTPGTGQWRVPVHEMYAEPRATQKLLDDAQVNVEQWLAGKVQRKFARTEANAFVLGDGITKPRGFLTYPDGVPSPSNFQVIERIKTGVDAALPATDPGDLFIDVQGKMKSPYVQRATWAMNRKTRAEIRKMKDGQGNYLLIMDYSTPGASTILGASVQPFEDMPDFDAAGALAIAYADWSSAYQIVDRMGIRVLRDPYTAKPFVKFYTTRRVGGDVLGFEAIKLIEFSA